MDIPKFLGGGATFAPPKRMQLLEDEGYRYTIHTKSNAVLVSQTSSDLPPIGNLPHFNLTRGKVER